MDEANRLFTYLFWWLASQWGRVGTFRALASEGRHHVTPKEASRNLALANWQYTSGFVENYLNGTPEEKKTAKLRMLEEVGGVAGLGMKYTEMNLEAYDFAVDAASLVLAHTTLDEVVTKCCQIAALVAPADFEDRISAKKITIGDAKTAGAYESLLQREALRYVQRELARKSLPKRLDILHCLCPPRKATYLVDYTYDRQAVANLDKLRHEVVHVGSVRSPLPGGDKDVTFLFLTGSYALALVNDRYDVKVDPEHAREFFGDRQATRGAAPGAAQTQSQTGLP